MTPPFDPALPLRPSSPVPPDVLARLGEAIAVAAERLQSGWPEMPDRAAVQAARLDELGLQLQALARVLSGHAPAAPEALDLGVALLQARAEWHAECQRRGLRLDGPRRDCVIHGSAGVLKQLIDLALGHLVELSSPGGVIQCEVDDPAADGTVTLRLGIGPGAGGSPLRDTAEELHWSLLRLLARHTGLQVSRQLQGPGVQLALRFPATADRPPRPAPTRAPSASGRSPTRRRKAPAAAAPSPVHSSEDPSFPSTDPRTVHLRGFAPAAAPAPPPVPEPAAAAVARGPRVLLLEPHEPTRRQALQRMVAAGLVVTAAVQTVAQAREAFGQAKPHWLVTGIGAADPSMAPWLADLQEREPGLRVLELADAGQPQPTWPGPGEAPLTRIARADIESALVAALTAAGSPPRGG